MALFKIVQLSKFRKLVSLTRMLDRYNKLLKICDNKQILFYTGGQFDLENCKTGEVSQVEISENNPDDFFCCFVLGGNEIIWVETTWDSNFNNITNTQQHLVRFNNKTIYYFGVMI